MSKLLIIESPNKIKSIEKYLGSEYKVMATKGHIRDLPKSRLGVEIDNDFKPQYINMTDKKDVIKTLKTAAANADAVYLATDPDREGEAISWHLAHILALDLNEANRVTFNEITKSGVSAGITSPRKLDLDLVDAQQARRVLDRIVGYQLSPFLWKKVKSGLSAGRVQTVALRLIVEREREIEKFEAVEYWTIDAKLASGIKTFSAKLCGDNKGNKFDTVENGEIAQGIVDSLENAEYKVVEVKKGKRNRQPAPPFITSTLQQEASRKLGFTGQRTMKVAQQLFEGIDIKGIGATGLITYMRTDSLRISEEARNAANKYITATFGEKYLPSSPRYFKSKSGAQDAHEAIRPTDVNLTPEAIKDSLTAEQYKLYKLIWERFLASLMSVCVQDTVTVTISAGDYFFKASGYSVRFDGFTVLYEEGKDEENEDSVNLPEMKVDDILKLKELLPNQHFTQPPARYTEPTLIKALEENGIGRPSTYASILSNMVQKREIHREYLAVACGNVPLEGSIVAPIARVDGSTIERCVDEERGEYACTHYKTLLHKNDYSLVSLKLETGRTHQIRVHMKHIGHPLLADARYGGDEILRGTTSAKYRQFVNNCFALCPRQALHARTLGFVHPETGEEMFFSAPVPDDMTAMIDKWRNYLANI